MRSPVCHAVRAIAQQPQSAVKYAVTAETPIGRLTLVEEDGALTEARFGANTEDCCVQRTPLLDKAVMELYEYFSGQRKQFDLPLKPQGTLFQQKCWQALLAIPYGETRTYGQQAALIGQPKACRAVGMGNNRNPLPVFIPCHRVIGANGRLTGYAGGLSIKEKLLQIERTDPI